MDQVKLPRFLENRVIPAEEVYSIAVQTGTKLASGFATSEPSRFYAGLWDYIQEKDLTDIAIRQALFMAPHRLCIGDALQSKGLLNGFANDSTHAGIFGNLARRANTITKKVEGLGKLIEHFRELQARRIEFVSAFIGAASNMVIPTNPLTRVLYPDFVGRNKTRMGIISMQSAHFPDAVDAMARDHEGKLLIDTFVLVMTPPDENGEMSHGVANGATGDMLEIALKEKSVKIILYLNPAYPFTRGYGEATNTVHVDRFKGAAREGRLFVVHDDTPIPALPPHSFDNPSPAEVAIAEHVVNHMEANRELTYGRAIQVGIGGTGVLAIKKLGESSWTGRTYTEMLEPFTLDLFAAGKVAGTHFIERDGRRTELDGKIVCTFTMAEDNSDFYQRLNRNPDIIISSAARVVVPEAFYYGLGINNILSIDFQGHVNSAGRDKNHYSGIGGAATIMRGLGRGGVAYLCMKSTHRTPDGKLRSSVQPFMPTGTPISIIGPDLMGTREGAKTYLVTEHGVAPINAMPQDRFIRNIISVADPQFRGYLKRRAWDEFRVHI